MPNQNKTEISFATPRDEEATHPEIGLRIIDRSVFDKRILETKTRRNRTRKSVPPRARKRSRSGHVREGENSRIRRPSESGHFSIKVLIKMWRFWAPAGPEPIGGFSGGPRRDVRRAARRDLQDDQRHDPRALVHHVSVPSRRLRFSYVRVFFVTSSSMVRVFHGACFG